MTETLAFGHIHKNLGEYYITERIRNADEEKRIRRIRSSEVDLFRDTVLNTHSSPSHSVVPSAIRATNNDCKLGDISTRNSANHLCSILCYPTLLSSRTNHVSGDINEEKERNLALRAQLDEVCGFECAGREQDSIVCYNAHWVTVDVSESLSRGVGRS